MPIRETLSRLPKATWAVGSADAEAIWASKGPLGTNNPAVPKAAVSRN